MHFGLSGLLPTSVVPTSRALLRLNDVFDILNSSSPTHPCPFKRALSLKNENDVISLLHEVRSWMLRWRIGDGVKAYFVAGLCTTITAILSIWEVQRDGALDFLLTRRFNQDGLENFLG